MRNTLPKNIAKVTILGRELYLSERRAVDVNALAEYAKDKNGSYTEAILQSLTIVADGLKINFRQLKWYNWIKRARYRKILDKSYLFEHLTAGEIFSYSTKVLELEGFDIKKKAMEVLANLPAESLSTPS